MSVTTEKVQGFQDPKSHGENEDQLPYVDRVRVGNGISVTERLAMINTVSPMEVTDLRRMDSEFVG